MSTAAERNVEAPDFTERAHQWAHNTNPTQLSTNTKLAQITQAMWEGSDATRNQLVEVAREHLADIELWPSTVTLIEGDYMASPEFDEATADMEAERAA